MAARSVQLQAPASSPASATAPEWTTVTSYMASVRQSGQMHDPYFAALIDVDPSLHALDIELIRRYGEPQNARPTTPEAIVRRRMALQQISDATQNPAQVRSLATQRPSMRGSGTGATLAAYSEPRFHARAHARALTSALAPHSRRALRSQTMLHCTTPSPHPPFPRPLVVGPAAFVRHDNPRAAPRDDVRAGHVSRARYRS
jgi:hypothetical protein